jgi:hypothetical protein
MADDTAALSEIDGSRQIEVDPTPGDDHIEGRLSTIPQGTHETEPSNDGYSSVGSYLQHADRELQEALNRVSDLLELPLPEELKKETRNELDDRMPLSLLTADVDEVTLAEPSTDVSASYVELGVSPPMTNTLSYLPRQPQPGEVVLLQVGPNTMRQELVQIDDNILTPAQLKEHWPEARRAMLKANASEVWLKKPQCTPQMFSRSSNTQCHHDPRATCRA